MDDETILSYGTILKYQQLGYTINLLTLCQAGRKLSNNNRHQAYLENTKSINTIQLNNKIFDLMLNKEYTEYTIKKYILELQPHIIFTHSLTDLHFEHRIVSESVILHCRKINKNSIKQLYCSFLPASLQAYGQFGNFQPNTFIDISDYIDEKINALKRYSSELPNEISDIRSIDSIITTNKCYGQLMNTGYCEAYQQLFSIL